MKIRLFGQRNILGGGVHYAEFCDALRGILLLETLIEEVDLTNNQELEAALRRCGDDDVNIWFWRHPAIAIARGYNVAWAIFESDFLPSDFVTYFERQADLVWVPSAWGRAVLVSNGVSAEKIDVVPEGVAAEKFHPFLRGDRRVRPEVFKFLIVGKYEERKGYAELLEAFAEAFRGRVDVELLIKADFFLKHDEKKQQMESRLKAMGLTNVTPLWGAWPEQQLYALFNHADAFVFPSKAEGWGLPLIQALACGLPVTATNYSGQSEYLSTIESNFVPISYSIEPIKDPEFLTYWPAENGRSGGWAKPDVNSIANALRDLFEDYDQYRQKGLIASELVRRSFDWSVAASIALTSLQRRERIRAQLKLTT